MKVLKSFIDKENKFMKCEEGDEYPVDGYSPELERVEYLKSEGFVEEIEEVEEENVGDEEVVTPGKETKGKKK